MKESKDRIPDINELEIIYKKEKRLEAERDFNTVNKSESMFFNKFRKSEKVFEPERIDENIYYKKYREYTEEELNNKKEEIEYLEGLINYEKFFLNWERKFNKKSKNFNGYGSTSFTRYRVDNIKKYENELNNLISKSKEAWEFYYHRLLKDYINKSHSGELINVNYVNKAKEKIINSIENDIPVYIVGHLGSGKTQLATEAAVEYSISLKIQNDLENIMENWFINNENAHEKEAFYKFREEYRKRKNYYKNLLKNGTKEEIESIQPLFISGSHNLTYEDMFVEKTLVLSQSFAKGSFSDYLEMIIGDFYQWMDSHKERLEKMTKEEQLNLKIQIWKSFSDLLVAKNSAFGTEVKKIEKEILKAVTEGKVVIVDELNTIAMQNLIALNDILQKNIGTKAYITGVGPVLIKEGFGFIGTGNISTDRVNYEGTNELNPAFKSRFTTIEYNYLNQNIKGSVRNQVNKSKNELFAVIISRIADKNGNINLPEAEKSMDELFRLAQLSKITQNVFMGKWKDNINDDYENIDDVELKESVLSIRNIIHVLDSWNMGEEKDLSMALWDGFISSITDADDENYILSQAVRFGFFSEEDGWNIVNKAVGDSITTYNEIRKRPYKYERANSRILSYLDVMDYLFDKNNLKSEIAERLKNEFNEILKKENHINTEEYENLDSEISKLEHSLDIFDYIKDRDDKYEN